MSGCGSVPRDVACARCSSVGRDPDPRRINSDSDDARRCSSVGLLGMTEEAAGFAEADRIAGASRFDSEIGVSGRMASGHRCTLESISAEEDSAVELGDVDSQPCASSCRIEVADGLLPLSSAAEPLVVRQQILNVSASRRAMTSLRLNSSMRSITSRAVENVVSLRHSVRHHPRSSTQTPSTWGQICSC